MEYKIHWNLEKTDYCPFHLCDQYSMLLTTVHVEIYLFYYLFVIIIFYKIW